MRLIPRCFSPRDGLVYLLMALAPGVLGCGGGKGTVTGTVTLDDKPLSVGTIAFQPAKGNAVSAPIKDGKYTVEGVPTGEARVTVDTKAVEQQLKPPDRGGQAPPQSMAPPPGMKMPPEAQKYFDERKQAANANQDAAKELRKNFRKVPEKYGKADTSGLTFKVQSGKGNTFDVPLKSQ